MNPFRQQIGIYYKNKEWADYILRNLVKDLTIDGSGERIYKDHIDLKDGSVIKIIPANDSSRGYRFTKSFIQEGIDYITYQNIIAPKNLWNECYVIKDYDGLSYSGEHYKADKYYKGLAYVAEHYDEFRHDIDEKIFKMEYECIWGDSEDE